jgi:hypothetical protein
MAKKSIAQKMRDFLAASPPESNVPMTSGEIAAVEARKKRTAKKRSAKSGAKKKSTKKSRKGKKKPRWHSRYHYLKQTRPNPRVFLWAQAIFSLRFSSVSSASRGFFPDMFPGL